MWVVCRKERAEVNWNLYLVVLDLFVPYGWLGVLLVLLLSNSMTLEMPKMHAELWTERECAEFEREWKFRLIAKGPAVEEAPLADVTTMATKIGIDDRGLPLFAVREVGLVRLPQRDVIRQRPLVAGIAVPLAPLAVVVPRTEGIDVVFGKGPFSMILH